MRAALSACLFAVAAHLHAAAQPPAVADDLPAACAGAGPSAASYGAGGAFVIHTGARPASVRRHALTITPDGGASIGVDPAWDAAKLPLPEPRNMYTYAGQATVPFEWASLPPELRALLNADGLGEERVAYLRGERRRELGQPEGVFRKREGVLGDIGRSVPLIVGAPAASSMGDGHEAFRAQAKGRSTAVYVGANDGMLHAFAAASGAELFAYVPQALIAPLAGLSDPGFKERAFADGSAGQGDALLGARWRTVLASGMGMGARGVFALDITDPSAFGRGMGALWEFTEKDDAGIGHVGAAPLVARLRTGANGRTSAYRFFAVVANGINSQAQDGKSALFLLAIDKPAAQRWQAGVNYDRIAIRGADPALPNALSAPGLVTAEDGSARLAYAGDLQGNLWRFDLGAKTARRLFTARDAGGHTQPIVHAPTVVFAPGGGYLVLFGTGKLIEQADFLPASYSPQSLYAIHDLPDGKDRPAVTRAQLAPRTLSGSGSYTVSGEAIDYFAPAAKRGWYVDFPNTRNDGERIAGSPSVMGGSVVFNSVLPGAGPCAPAASRTYVLDALSGLAGAKRDEATGQLAPSATLLPPLLLEVNAETGARDATGAATATRTYAVIAPSAAGAVPRMVTVRFPAKRLGWREVVNWQELHDAAQK